ncbi:MAG TPA: DUF882 domain-containing protein [Candidatus Eisenbacteria bacterium]|nr:DUF882 domain-containing protein [Candidatus Eisenbacteria bacterium]
MMLAVLAVATTLAAPRFFLEGDGTLALTSAHSGDKATVRYRRADGSYDPDALAQIRRVLRSRDGAEGDVALRLVELLGHVYVMRGKVPLTIVSGYRSPDYNEAIRARGARAASESLHTEGLAADVAFPGKQLRPLWMQIRSLDCCGAGYYQSEGFLHLDVGRPRFWEPATSKVEQHLSAGNALVFARTEFDRYATGETIIVELHAMTAPPVLIAKDAVLAGGTGETKVRVEADLPEREGCWDVAERGVRMRVVGAPAAARGRLTLRTCTPRVEKTPETVATNPIEVR